MLLPLGMAEVRIARAGGDDERVVGELVSPAAVRETVEEDPVRPQVDVVDLGEHDPGVALSLDDRAQRARDLCW